MFVPEGEQMRSSRALFFGGMIGLAVCLFAVVQSRWEFGCFWRVLRYIFTSPVWIVLPCPQVFGAYAGLIWFLVLVLEYALIGWFVGVAIRTAQRHRRVALFAITLIGVSFCIGYGLTWVYARDMVKAKIQIQQAADFQRRQYLNAGGFSREPELQIMMCIPVFPLVVACEYDYVYGGLDGGGECSLWFWSGRDVKEFFCYVRWRH